jgi:uncharacterized membrane protein YfcA
MDWFGSFSFMELLPFIAVGFAAQLIDGALGMAFGVISSTLMVGLLGVPPAVASTGVHIVESFTTGASGISHALHRNVNWKLFARLLIPGVVGGILGAYVLTSIDASVARPLVMIYLTVIGLYLLYRGFGFPLHPREPKIVEPLGFAGGFLDAAGGGGWGPVVTSNLIVQGSPPRQTIGTVSATEFFLTVTISITFLLHIGAEGLTPEVMRPMLGLLIGGIVAAPLGAIVAKRVPTRGLLLMVGTVLTLTSAYSVWTALN